MQCKSLQELPANRNRRTLDHGSQAVAPNLRSCQNECFEMGAFANAMGGDRQAGKGRRKRALSLEDGSYIPLSRPLKSLRLLARVR